MHGSTVHKTKDRYLILATPYKTPVWTSTQVLVKENYSLEAALPWPSKSLTI